MAVEHLRCIRHRLQPGGQAAPAIRAAERRQPEGAAVPARQLRGEALALRIALPRREPGEPDDAAVGEQQVAMPIEAGEVNRLGRARRRANVVRGPRRGRPGCRNGDKPHDRRKGRLHPHPLYAKRKNVRPGSSAG
ncbi:hypothetical protein [Bosea sp. CS1GBMeth4]|uniref:hypothetical protein n=1 Tax=Bosea sp. CS1GBMeth4 TaxID=1892849 RepID=UPI001647D449|nr:hypothetical protein [Bosea sp. CS1GBMeth4]